MTRLTSQITIVAPTTVQNGPASNLSTTASVSTSISTFTKKYAIPNVTMISGIESTASTGLTIQLTIVKTSAASASVPNAPPYDSLSNTWLATHSAARLPR